MLRWKGASCLLAHYRIAFMIFEYYEYDKDFRCCGAPRDIAWLALNVAPGAEAVDLRIRIGIAPVMANLRTATSYARTGNIALAQIETTMPGRPGNG